MTADIRADVLAGIKRVEMGVYWRSDPVLVQAARDALRLLREEMGKHKYGFDRPEWCLYCHQVWPCPSIRAGAQVYAPDALKEKPDAD